MVCVGTTIHLADITQETRWPKYLAALRARQLPVGSAMAFSLELDDVQLGALALYAAQPRYFTDLLIGIGSILADHASIALGAVALADNNLKVALISNRRIGMAIGILMALHHIDELQAFELLRRSSQRSHIKLRTVAEEVILTGSTSDGPRRRST
jgi:GAF domain-containing protein